MPSSTSRFKEKLPSTAKRLIGLTAFSLLVFTSKILSAAPPFYFGNDLSVTNQMEDCGGVYRENSAVKDPFQIVADHGANLVRVRLWNDPWWMLLIPQTAPNAKVQYSDFTDVVDTIAHAKSVGMAVMLDLPLSDFWADPARLEQPD